MKNLYGDPAYADEVRKMKKQLRRAARSYKDVEALQLMKER
jgi:hypothetical protein